MAAPPPSSSGPSSGAGSSSGSPTAPATGAGSARLAPAAGGITAAHLAERVGGRVEGDPATLVRDVAPIGEAGPHHVTFAVGEANENKVASSSAGCFIVREGFSFAETLPRGRALIRHRAPQLGFAQAVRLFRPEPPLLEPGVHPRAAVHPSASVAADAGVGALAVVEAGAVLAAGALILPHAYIGAGARVGAGTVIHPNAVIARGCEVGARCIIHSGAVIGADGFGFAPDPDTGLPQKIPQVGRVVIEDDVEVGANTTIDRAALGETRIRRGVKIDNLVQIGHNVEIGMGSIIVAQAGISGSTRLGRGVIVAAQAGVVDHVTIGDRAIIGASAGVTKDVKAGEAVLGQPAIPAGQAKRALALLARLPEMHKDIRRIDKRLDAIDAERPA